MILTTGCMGWVAAQTGAKFHTETVSRMLLRKRPHDASPLPSLDLAAGEGCSHILLLSPLALLWSRDLESGLAELKHHQSLPMLGTCQGCPGSPGGVTAGIMGFRVQGGGWGRIGSSAPPLAGASAGLLRLWGGEDAAVSPLMHKAVALALHLAALGRAGYLLPTGQLPCGRAHSMLRALTIATGSLPTLAPGLGLWAL